MAKKQNFLISIIIIGSILFFIFTMSVLISSLGKSDGYSVSGTGSKIALVEVKGVIYSAENIVRQLDKYSRNKSVKAIVLRIESPGGGIAPSQEMYEKIKRVRDSGMPIVASMGSVAASGGYYIACGADTIMANLGTTTGSIGVIAEVPNTTELFEKIGVHFNVIKSGKYKDTGSPHRKMTEADKKHLQEWVDDAYEQFVDVVTTERKLDRHHVLKYADGRIYTGKQALENELIDLIGSYEDAIELAAKLGGIDSDNPKTIKESKRKVTMFDLLFEDYSRVFDVLQKWPRLKYQLVL